MFQGRMGELGGFNSIRALMTSPSLIFLAFLATIMLRSVYAFDFPVFYAEDGTWTTRILANGFWDAAFNARQEFPVFGMVLLQFIALQITDAVFGGDFSQAPVLIALISCIFIAGVAVLPFVCMRQTLGGWGAFVLGLFIVLMPVGEDAYEIFGRILNLVWYTTILAQICLFCLLYLNLSWPLQAVNLATVLILMLTFPVVIGQFILFAVFFVWREREAGKNFFKKLAIYGGLLVMVLAALWGKNIGGKGGGALEFNPSGFIEFAIARSILYPLIAPFYHSMNDFSVVIILAALIACLCSIAWFTRKSFRSIADQRVFFLLNFGLVLLALVVMRNGLTFFFRDYSTTFPDRYFVGANIGLMFVISAFLAGFSGHLAKLVVAACYLAILTGWFYTPYLFSSVNPPMMDRTLGTLKDTMCAKQAGQFDTLQPAYDGGVTIPIYPVADGLLWRMTIPQDVFEVSVALQCGMQNEAS